MFRRQWVCCVFGVVALVLVGCGGAAVPQDALSAAQASVKAAEVGGAADNPTAELHLQYAVDQIAEAQRLIEDGENEAAAALLARAEIDAELALKLAQVEQARQEASAARQEIKELQKR